MEEARAPMLWGAAQDDDLHAFYRRLIHFRRQHPTLWQGVRRTVHLNEAAGTWAYTCADEEETILVVFNAGTETRSFTAAGRAVTLAPWEGDLLAL
jgi:glycosidase